MVKCPNCDSKKTIFYPKGFSKENNKPYHECTICGCEFDYVRSNLSSSAMEGRGQMNNHEKLKIYTPGKEILMG
jgi:Zn ribbon nucleic-acid-binding protein